jgi:hypothetical protein
MKNDNNDNNEDIVTDNVIAPGNEEFGFAIPDEAIEKKHKVNPIIIIVIVIVAVGIIGGTFLIANNANNISKTIIGGPKFTLGGTGPSIEMENLAKDNMNLAIGVKDNELWVNYKKVDFNDENVELDNADIEIHAPENFVKINGKRYDLTLETIDPDMHIIKTGFDKNLFNGGGYSLTIDDKKMPDDYIQNTFAVTYSIGGKYILTSIGGIEIDEKTYFITVASPIINF